MPVMKRKLSAPEFFGAMQDGRLGIKERGILATLQTLDLNEQFSLEGIAANMKDGYPTIRTAVRNLEKLGYVERLGTYDEHGKKNGSEYRLYNDQD